ncbi:MAG: protoporphyrinogen oxidase, partial [Bacteroidota bacterium]
MPDQSLPYVVLGGGLSGLAAAYELQLAGKDFLLIEKENTLGGKVQSRTLNGLQLELGANSAATHPALEQLIKELALEEDVVPASEIAKSRFLVRDQQIHRVWPSPAFLLKTRLLSRRGKWQLVREPWRPAKKLEQESVADFFRRRLGDEAYQYLVNPVLGGIYAGDPEKMSMAAIWPQIQAWEQEYGSLFKALRARQGKQPARQIWNFKEGMQHLPNMLAEQFADRIRAGQKLKAIKLLDGEYELLLEGESGEDALRATRLIWALPAHQGHLLGELSEDLVESLLAIPYVSMGMIHLAYPESADLPNLDGFGFLIPEQESKLLLGAISNSSVFPTLAPSGQGLYTLFVGGSRTPFADAATFEARAEEAIDLFTSLMGIQQRP